MNGDNGQYEYDELRWLARDTRKSRRRGIWWTAGLVLGAMTLATVYVQRDPSTPTAPPSQSDTTNFFSRSPTVTLDASSLEPSLSRILTALNNINNKLPAVVNLRVFSDAPVEGLSNLVWLVDGSRRFPMAVNDVLWIPEINQWIRLQCIGKEGFPPDDEFPPCEVTQVLLSTVAPTSLTSGDQESLPQWLPAVRGQLGNIDCAAIHSRGPSQRPGFRRRDNTVPFVDIEVELFIPDAQRPCPPR